MWPLKRKKYEYTSKQPICAMKKCLYHGDIGTMLQDDNSQRFVRGLGIGHACAFCSNMIKRDNYIENIYLEEEK